jgi:hypothetical protein
MDPDRQVQVVIDDGIDTLVVVDQQVPVAVIAVVRVLLGALVMEIAQYARCIISRILNLREL